MVQVPGTVHFSPGRALDADACPSGGAGMVGTADDVLRLLDMLQSDGGGLLSPHTLRRMTSLQADAEAQAHGPGWAFGYGWAVLADPDAAQTPQSIGR